MKLNTPEKTALLSGSIVDFEYDEVRNLDNFDYIIVLSKERLSTNTSFIAKHMTMRVTSCSSYRFLM